MKWFGPTQFALYRIILGLYLTIHFVRLLPFGVEIFSNQGVIKDAQLLPGYGKLPIFILNYDDPTTVTFFLSSLVIASITFTCGIYRRISSLWLYYGWMSLLNRNPLINNPSLGYIGWILLACSVIPKGERVGFFLSNEKKNAEKKNNYTWEMPDIIGYGFWIILGTSCMASGIHKFSCPDWLNGNALYYVLTGSLVRQNSCIVRAILYHPIFWKTMTWGSLFLEVSFLFFGTFYRLRCLYWLAVMGFHFGIITTINFVDLTVGMIMAHLFTFDASWFKFTKDLVIKYDLHGRVPSDYNEYWWDIFQILQKKDYIIGKDVVVDISNDCDIQNDDANIQNNDTNIQNDDANIVNNDIQTKNNSKDSNDSNAALATVTVAAKGKNDICMSSWLVYAIITCTLAFLVAIKCDIYSAYDRFSRLTVDMYWGFGFLIVSLAILMILERIYPDQQLEYVPGWWMWVLIINAFQLFAVILASFTWENWLQHTSYFTSTAGFHLRDYVTPFWGGLIAYFINLWLFYWWHYGRHEVYFLWILLHQFHHSPSRIETITSFYKHPLEIIVNSQIMAILLYSILGLSNESSIWLSIFSGIGEYVYHMNIKTPWILGFFFQRPESHRIHHLRNRRHCYNHSDLPLLDILGGTFLNPNRMTLPCGFSIKWEVKRISILHFKDVITNVHQNIFANYLKFKKTCIRYVWYALVIWGTLNAIFFIAHHEGMRDIGFATVSSPLPLVFSSYRGFETFATSFYVKVKYQNGTYIEENLGVERYGLLGGAYNRRNVYGALFSHSPFFVEENLINIRQGMLYYAICKPGCIMDELQLFGNVKSVHVDILYRPENNRQIGELYVNC